MTDTWYFDALPYRPTPHPDECLSGYILRLAAANGSMRLLNFSQLLFPDGQQIGRMNALRWEYPQADWGNSPQLTQCGVDGLTMLTLLPLVRKFYVLPPTRRAGWAIGHTLRDIVDPHLKICPVCVRETPYVRLLWRFTLVDICLKHRRKLVHHCPCCKNHLTVITSKQRHLHCSYCDADLTQGSWPMQPATSKDFAAQQTIQNDLRFLLNPSVALTRLEIQTPIKTAWRGDEVTRHIGLKFRHLRDQRGMSAWRLELELNMSKHSIYDIESGLRAPISRYQFYLSALGHSWADFAALETPATSQVPKPIRYLELRVCPTPGCIYSHAPAGLGIHLCVDVPKLQAAKFRCKACHRKFTRTYSGEYRVRRKTPLARPAPHKSTEENEKAIALGLRGVPNQVITQTLGWGNNDMVTQLWIRSELLIQVQRAQADCAATQQQQRDASLHSQIEGVLRELRCQNQKISLARVCRALGKSQAYLNARMNLRALILDAAQHHNPNLNQQRHGHEAIRLRTVLESLPQRSQPVTLSNIATELGRSTRYFGQYHPDLWQSIRAAVRNVRVQTMGDHVDAQIHKIDQAATQLLKNGTPLTQKSILEEASLSFGVKAHLPVKVALQKWTAGLPPPGP